MSYVSQEEGHMSNLLGGLLGAVGALLLVWGVAGEMDWLSCVGGTVVAVAFLAGHIYGHSDVDHGIYARLDALEKKK